MDPVYSTLINVLISIMTVCLTTHIAIRRFRSEKWWEAQANIYNQLIELVYARLDAVENSRRELMNGDGSSSKNLFWSQNEMNDFKRKIYKFRTIYALHLSEEAKLIIDAYLDRLDRDMTEISIERCLERAAKSSKDCMNDLIVEAQRHLKYARRD